MVMPRKGCGSRKASLTSSFLFMLKKLLVKLNILSPCCFAFMENLYGWNRRYCTRCGKRVA